jgi:hypothetical protein
MNAFKEGNLRVGLRLWRTRLQRTQERRPDRMSLYAGPGTASLLNPVKRQPQRISPVAYLIGGHEIFGTQFKATVILVGPMPCFIESNMAGKFKRRTFVIEDLPLWWNQDLVLDKWRVQWLSLTLIR